MKHCLLVSICLIVFAPGLRAQFFEDGGPAGSFVIRFTTDTIPEYLPDTATVPLWQIGRTHKAFFTYDTSGITGMMTDTLSNYPINANNWFVLKIPNGGHPLISFWHRYQTDPGVDRGSVEYSLNKGLTWNNVKDSCNIDGWATLGGILTSNFYSGMSFSGSSTPSVYSQFQFAGYPGLKSTAGTHCSFYDVDTFYIRFHFISDATSEPLAGWFIDSVKVNYYNQSTSVKDKVASPDLTVTPNPSRSGIFFFPYLENKDELMIDVYNTLGQRVLQTAYCRSLDLSQFPYGLYFFKVTDGNEYYSGRLLYE